MRKEIKILLVSDAIMLVPTGLFGPIYAVYVQQIGGTILTAGWAYSVFAITTGLLILAISKFEDRVREKKALVPFGYALFALGILGYLYVSKPIHLYLVQIILGIATAITTPLWDALFSEYLDEGRYAEEWGIEEAQTYIFTAAAAGTGSIVVSNYGFDMLFIIMFLFALVGTWFSLQLLNTSSDKPGHRRKSLPKRRQARKKN